MLRSSIFKGEKHLVTSGKSSSFNAWKSPGCCGRRLRHAWRVHLLLFLLCFIIFFLFRIIS